MTSLNADGRTFCSPLSGTRLLGKAKPWRDKDANGGRESHPAPNFQPVRWGTRDFPWLWKHMCLANAQELINYLTLAPVSPAVGSLLCLPLQLLMSFLLPHYVVFLLPRPTPGPLPENKCSPFPYIFITFPDFQLPKRVFREDFSVFCRVR